MRNLLKALLVVSTIITVNGRLGYGALLKNSYEDHRVSMACTYSISVYGKKGTDFKPIVDAAFDEVDRIDRLMSHYKSDSPLSKINQAPANHSVKVEPELFDFLAECFQYSKSSDGAFDITVGPLMKAWGFFRGEGRLPTDAELSKTRKIIGYQHVILDSKDHTIKFDRTGVEAVEIEVCF